MFTAWQPPTEIAPVHVLRKELRGPVTLGHVLLLDEMQSPVVKGGEIAIGDLALAVAVCLAKDAAEAREDVSSRLFLFLTQRWARRCATLDFAAECEKFGDWFGAQCSGPVYEDQPAGRDAKPRPPLSAPWYISLLALAVGELGMRVEDAEAMPVKRLRQLTAALSEMRGQATIRTETTHTFIEQVREWERERMGGAA